MEPGSSLQAYVLQEVWHFVLPWVRVTVFRMATSVGLKLSLLTGDIRSLHFFQLSILPQKGVHSTDLTQKLCLLMSSQNPVKNVNMSWVSWEEDEALWKFNSGRVFFCVGREVVECKLYVLWNPQKMPFQQKGVNEILYMLRVYTENSKTLWSTELMKGSDGKQDWKL